MTALDEILRKIRTSAQSQAENIIEEAKSKSKIIKSNAESEAESIKNNITTQIEIRISKIEENTEKQIELIKSQTVLDEKQSIINKIIKNYHNQLLNLPTPQYFSLLENMLIKYNPIDKTIFLNQNDIKRIPKFFSKLKINISNSPVDIDGGFILSNGNIEENCSFQSMIDSNKEIITDKLNSLIFGEI